MDTIRLGRTGMMVSAISFGALPIQRVDMDTASAILRKAYAGGVNFYDTARNYTDSEAKLGNALSDVRKDIFLATKTHATKKDALNRELETSLSNLKTDYLDLYQLHFVRQCPDLDDPNSAAAELLRLKQVGVVRHIGISAHSLAIARQTLALGVFDTIQYPLSYLSTEDEIAFTHECARADVGFIAMKAFAGGMITNAPAAYAFMRSLPHVAPVFGIQRVWELDLLLDCERQKTRLDDSLLEQIETDRRTIGGNYCRGCGYCSPCPADIPISSAIRMDLFVKRFRTSNFLTEEWVEKMHRIDQCTHCNACVARCPYGLDIPNMLQEKLQFYDEFRKNYRASDDRTENGAADV